MISPQKYLDSVLDYIQTEALQSSVITDWSALRLECQARIAGAQTTAETYPVIRYVLSLLGDRHSFFQAPETVRQIIQPEKPLNSLPTGRRLSSNIGYIMLTPIITPSTFEAYITAVHRIIQANTAPLVDGWIIDLRQNTGGNMYPMLIAIGEILGEGIAGQFVSLRNEIVPWSYRSGGAYYGDELVYQVQKPDFDIACGQLPVAVLISSQTASSGEILAISFIGRASVKLFGEPTYGLTTSNKVIPLSDDAQLVLTTDFVADRTGKTYTGAVIPDEIIVVDRPHFGEDDPVIIAALRWFFPHRLSTCN